MKQYSARVPKWLGSLALSSAMWSMALPAQSSEAPQALTPGSMASRVAACTGCHGAQGRAGTDGYYPRLAGKPQMYLYNQLLNFRDGARTYRPMTHLLQGLPDQYLQDMAAYFADQVVPYPAPSVAAAPASITALGATLVRQGDPARGLPACASCHGATLGGIAPAIPGLLGLPRDYLASQLGGWRSGLRHAHEPDCMAEIVGNMTPEDIAAVSVWLSSQPVPAAYAVEPASERKLPLACGSQHASGAAQ